MLYKFVVCIEALVWSGGLATKEYVYIILYSVFDSCGGIYAYCNIYKCTRCDHSIIFPPPPISNITILPTPLYT